MNIILVDTSYTSFHRFFATKRWFSFAKKEMYKEYKDDPSYNWSKNEIFMDKYNKMYLESIQKLVTKDIFNNSKIIFCMDCPQADIWRHDISDDYKGNRVDFFHNGLIELFNCFRCQKIMQAQKYKICSLIAFHLTHNR